MQTAQNGPIELAYDTLGDGPPLLLISGTSADRGIWHHVRPRFAERFRTVAFDNRDSGRSSLAPASYGVGDLVADAIAVLDASGIADTHLLGHSMGGVVAQELALAHPLRVRSLTLVNSWARADTYARTAFELARDLTLAIGDDALRLRALYFMGLGTGALSAMPLGGIVAGVLASSPAQPREALARQWSLDLTLDTLDRLGAISAPTHVIWSAGDRFFPERHAQQLVTGIRGAVETRMADHVGHCPMVEDPLSFVEAVLSRLPTVAE